MEIKPNLLGNMRNGDEFIDKMDIVLRDLRADFDVATAEHSKKKIAELKKVHVDVTGFVSSLAVKAVGSNGFVNGLRGTGKSHLMLIARDRINSSRKSFCVYVNLKEQFKIGDHTVVNERFYVWAILKQLKRQISSLVDNSPGENLFQKMRGFFSGATAEKKMKVEKLEGIFQTIDQYITIGESEVQDLLRSVNASTQSGVSESYKDGIEMGISASPSLKGKSENVTTSNKSTTNNQTYKSSTLLSTSSLQPLLTEIVEVLQLDSIVFFYDEWSMLEVSDQNLLSKIIRAMSTSPIFHWIAYIPYKSSVGVLEQTADMPHRLDLDLQFIFEEDNNVCLKYFTKFIDNRLESVFGTNVLTINSIIKPQFFELLVKASMGNTRDFGVMLNKAWQLYKQDYLIYGNKRFINKNHVVSAIKSVAEEKLENLQKKNVRYSERLWTEIVKFVGEKKHTHFCIELDQSNIEYISEEEMQDLLYHRLVHLRKKDMTPKDGGLWRLSMYAVDVSVLYSRIFETKSDRKKIKLVTDVNVIHNQVRRYIFALANVVDEFRLLQGKQVTCPNHDCKRFITEDMTIAWKWGICPYCGTPLPNPNNITLNVAN